MNVCTIGDLLVDVIVHAESPIALDTDTFSEIEITAGGQAANVAAWVATLGHRARLICARFTDPPGSMLEAELQRRGIDAVGPHGEGRTGTVVSLAGDEGIRTMLTDRGDAPSFEESSLEAGWFDALDWLHVSGYSLAAEPLRATALRAAENAAGAGGRVSIDLASVRVIEKIGPATVRRLLGEIRPTVVFATSAERAALEHGSGSVSHYATWVTKHGAAGCTVEAGTDSQSFRALPTSLVDTTGAGDAFAAGFLCGGVETALEAAAACVARNGAMP